MHPFKKRKADVEEGEIVSHSYYETRRYLQNQLQRLRDSINKAIRTRDDVVSTFPPSPVERLERNRCIRGQEELKQLILGLNYDLICLKEEEKGKQDDEKRKADEQQREE